jgi:uncharacterized protein (TIGR02300 family)
MSKPARGTKRVCSSCGAKFYDLDRSPITCPVCQAVYQVLTQTSRRSAPAPQSAEVSKPKETEANPPVVGGAEVISLEEAEEAEDSTVEDEEIVDLGDDDEDIPADDDEDTFLEEEEEGDTDVSGIVGGGPKDEN